jgi:hypothetical protein
VTTEDTGMNGGEIGLYQTAAHDPSQVVTYEHYVVREATKAEGTHTLKMPTVGQLLTARFKERKFLLSPWLREQENCMVYAANACGPKRKPRHPFGL